MGAWRDVFDGKQEDTWGEDVDTAVLRVTHSRGFCHSPGLWTARAFTQTPDEHVFPLGSWPCSVLAILQPLSSLFHSPHPAAKYLAPPTSRTIQKPGGALAGGSAGIVQKVQVRFPVRTQDM